MAAVHPWPMVLPQTTVELAPNQVNIPEPVNQPFPGIQFPRWIIVRLFNSIGSHYESSLYGPYASLLAVAFPFTRQFMIKPQGLLREITDQDVGNISTDSTGAIVSNASLHWPDFVVVKADATSSNDHTLCVIEIKPLSAHTRLEESRSQLMRYMELVADRDQRDPHVYGLLVNADNTEVYHLSGAITDNQVVTIIPDGICPSHSAMVQSILLGISREWWTT